MVKEKLFLRQGGEGSMLPLSRVEEERVRNWRDRRWECRPGWIRLLLVEVPVEELDLTPLPVQDAEEPERSSKDRPLQRVRGATKLRPAEWAEALVWTLRRLLEGEA